MRKMRSLKEKGFSLVEVITATTIVGVLLLAWMQFNSGMIKSQRGLAQMGEVDYLNMLISASLTSPESCRQTFLGLVPDNAYHNIVLKKSDGTTQLGTGRYTANLEIMSIQAKIALSTKVIEARQGTLAIKVHKYAKSASPEILDLSIPFSAEVALNIFWKCAYPNTPVNGHIIFITKNSYDGNLGGLTGADTICQTEANTAGYGKLWRAVLGDQNVAARDRFIVAGPVFNTRGDLIAENEYDLWDGTIRNPVRWGINPSDDFSGDWTFTGSDPKGNIDSAHISPTEKWCDNWTSTNGNSGNIGQGGAVNGTWISSYGPPPVVLSKPCNLANGRLYCISQWTP